jgi:hypothetical protein
MNRFILTLCLGGRVFIKQVDDASQDGKGEGEAPVQVLHDVSRPKPEVASVGYWRRFFSTVERHHC